MPAMPVDEVFVDTNILVFSSHEGSPHHWIAREVLNNLQNSGVRLWISRQVLREYLAVLTRISMISGPRVHEEIIQDVKRFEEQFRIVEDGPVVTLLLLDLLREYPTAGKQIHDANIVATMLSMGVHHLLTDNVADFQRYSTLIRIHPLNTAEIL